MLLAAVECAMTALPNLLPHGVPYTKINIFEVIRLFLKISLLSFLGFRFSSSKVKKIIPAIPTALKCLNVSRQQNRSK
jgi:hypothetical protein